MEELLKKDFLNVINSVRRGDAPEWTAEATMRVENISDHLFDVDDPKDDAATVKRAVGEGVALGDGGQAPVPSFIFSKLHKNTPIPTEKGESVIDFFYNGLTEEE